MDYSDENLYQQLIALSHLLHHSRGQRGRMGFPPHQRPGGLPCREAVPEDMPLPPMRPDARGGFAPPFPDSRPPLARERILRLVGETEPVSQVRLAELLAIRPQSLSEQLAKLEKDGLILRTPSAQDKRVLLVSLTEEGRQRAQEVEAARSGQISSFLAPLSQEEREQLSLLLQKLLARG